MNGDQGQVPQILLPFKSSWDTNGENKQMRRPRTVISILLANEPMGWGNAKISLM